MLAIPQPGVAKVVAYHSTVGHNGLLQRSTKRTVNLGLHEANCTICAHARRENIERDFVAWRSRSAIAAEYALPDRSTVYRHAHAWVYIRQTADQQLDVEGMLEKTLEIKATDEQGTEHVWFSGFVLKIRLVYEIG